MEPSTNSDGCNVGELKVPDWLNAQFFERALQNYRNDPDLKVVDVKTAAAGDKGDHYASVMFRSCVQFTSQGERLTTSLIIKTMAEQGAKKDLLGDSKVFSTEIGMYTKALPKFEEILRKAGDNTKLCVPCVYHSLVPHQVIVMEDLVAKGYTLVKNREGTIEELKAAYSKLAKWQAVSFQILHEDPDFFKEFNYGMFDIPKLFDNSFMTTGMKLFLEFLDTVPELSKYKAFFKSIENDYIDRLRDVMLEYRENRQPNGYYVLCHNDFHLKNMMFKHNKTNGSLEDCMLLDFQSNNIVPISIDVIYSIYMLMGLQDRRIRHTELVNFYFTEFCETLQKIGFTGELPNSDEFWKQISNHKYYDIFLLTTFLPMTCGFRMQLDSAEILEKEDARRKLYYLDEYVEDVKHLLIRFEEQGYFQ